ncbi:MAG: helix-turn-helix transcriptional regulator [Deltaproteobacteria bacterium]|nr:helix-turn-helix transcriptional regulator [Deltaproteobacteria bacterium]
MQALTKKRLTEKSKTMTIRLRGPRSKAKKVLRVARQHGFVEYEESELVDWRSAFDFTEEQEPGVALKGARRLRGLTQQQLADATGIFRHHISEMENHKRPIGKKNARFLAKTLDVSYKVFL